MADAPDQNKTGHGESAPGTLDLPIPPHLKSKLEEFQQRLWSLKIAEGALAGLIGLALSYFLVFSLDRFFDTPFLLRAGVLFSGFAIPATVLPLRWHRWVSRQQSLPQIARLLKRRYPRLGDELLGIVELAESRTGDGSRALVQAAMRQVDERVRNEDFDEAVPATHYRTLLGSAGAAGILSLVLLLFVSDAARNALERWVAPWKPVERYTFARLDPLAKDVVVPYAESFDLATRLADSSEWKPQSGTIRLPGKTKLEAPRVEDAYSFDIPPQREPGELSIRVGDDRRRISLSPLPRPELTDLHLALRLPDYLRYESDPVVPVRGASVPVLAGASVVVTGETSRELHSATGTVLRTRVEGSAFTTEPFLLEQSIQETFTWEDVHGLKAKAPLDVNLVAVEDAPPEIVARQVSTERIVLENEVVSFDVRATDDFGVRTIGLVWHGERSPVAGAEPTVGEKPVAAGAPEQRELESTATFSPSRENVSPQTVHVRAYVEDYLPDRERVYSPTFVLHVLSTADHADWISREFGKWFRNAREVYEREQQLYETNRNLRMLSSEALDDPENRRRLQEQASGETANARRLDALTRAGRDIVRQAAKNDEFDAQRLESWAEMMRALDDIASNRMPGVADLLQEASRAEGAAPGETAEEGTAPSSGGGEKGETSDPQETGDEAPAAASGVSSETSESEPPSETEASTGDSPAPPLTPSISDRESSLVQNEEEPDAAPEARSTGESPLTLPSTMLDSPETSGEPESPGPVPPVAEKLDEALEKQEELLAEFARVTDELQEILSSLEASTFVKRLKAASRRQTELASALNSELGGTFGLPRNRIEQRFRDLGEATATSQEEQSQFIYHIQSDLEAYFQRKQDAIFQNVLQQMKDLSVVSNIKEIGRESLGNLSGRSIAASEYWADTLDRWAEELVAAASEQQQGAGEGESKDGLPPEVVLEVMKVLQEQMYLRDETREMESARPGFSPNVFSSKARPLELTQASLRERVDDVVADILELPDGERVFTNEVQLLNLVSDTMRESRAVLARPDTGPETIAAQTEAIELLLQSNRQPPGGGGGGGGGGSSPGEGGSAGGGGSPALSDISGGLFGAEPSATESREVDQSTGRAGRELPEEFRRGLDQYFNAIESK